MDMQTKLVVESLLHLKLVIEHCTLDTLYAQLFLNGGRTHILYLSNFIPMYSPCKKYISLIVNIKNSLYLQFHLDFKKLKKLLVSLKLTLERCSIDSLKVGKYYNKNIQVCRVRSFESKCLLVNNEWSRAPKLEVYIAVLVQIYSSWT